MPRTDMPTKKKTKEVSPSQEIGELEWARHSAELSNMMVSSIVDRMSSSPTTRSALAQRLGYEYQGDRDVYTALGYTINLQWEDYYGRYKRGDIAKRIVTAPVKETWRNVPAINETVPDGDKTAPGERTVFEKGWDELVNNKNLKLFHFLRKADNISGIGRWGVMFLGFSDANSQEDFAKPVVPGDSNELLYITPLNESQAQISTIITDASNPRFGTPEFYDLQFQNIISSQAQGRTSSSSKVSSTSVRIHWSRIIHIAENAEGDSVVGTPRLEAVYNRLMDLDRVVGSSGESFWRNAFPGLQFQLDPDHTFTDKQDLTELKSQIDAYVHKMERYIRTKGVTIEQLSTAIADPKGSFEVILSVIAGTTAIPQRILIGSERGELASSTDQTQWANVIEERREQHVEPVILDEFIARLVMAKVLPEAKGWTYAWPDLLTPGEKERAEIAAKRTEALAKYADSMNSSQIVPIDVFLRSEKFLGFSEEEAQKIEETLEKQAAEMLLAAKEEQAQIDREVATIAAEAALSLPDEEIT